MAQKPSLPPGPTGLALVRMFVDLSYTLVDYRKRYGDPMTLPTPMGRMVITSSPEGNKAIFTADPDLFVPAASESFGPILGHSVLLQSGAEHRRSRKLLTPPFHGERMRAYGELMKKTAQEQTATIPLAKPFRMIDLTQAITLSVIIQAVFGVADPTRMEAFRKELLAVLGSFSPFLFVPALRRSFFGMGPWARFVRHRQALTDLVRAQIEDHRKSLPGRTDILSLLLSARTEEGDSLSEEEIFDQLLTIVFAGHETSAVMLAWMFYLLHKYPETLAELQKEIGTLPADAPPEVIAKLPYLEAVCNETLRLYPPVHVIHRKLVAPMTLSGYELPKGTVVATGAFTTHRDETLYPEPTKFKPERFLGRTYTPFEFFPFGGGNRRCLGAAFAVYEMKLVLFAMARGYRFKLLEKGEVGLVNRPGTVGPKGGIRMQREALP